jgi:hypothetical protein
VLLIPGTALDPRANFDWNYEPALDAAGIPWCALAVPRYGTIDVQETAEYVVHALRRMHAESGRRVSIVGFSQGGTVGRWALKWWPDTRAIVEDLIGLSPSNHGTLSARAVCLATCPPSFWQQLDGSRFIAASAGPSCSASRSATSRRCAATPRRRARRRPRRPSRASAAPGAGASPCAWTAACATRASPSAAGASGCAGATAGSWPSSICGGARAS